MSSSLRKKKRVVIRILFSMLLWCFDAFPCPIAITFSLVIGYDNNKQKNLKLMKAEFCVIYINY